MFLSDFFIITFSLPKAKMMNLSIKSYISAILMLTSLNFACNGGGDCRYIRVGDGALRCRRSSFGFIDLYAVGYYFDHLPDHFSISNGSQGFQGLT